MKQFKQQQEEIQKRLSEELDKEKEKNKHLESKLGQSKLSVDEWKNTIITQLDKLRETFGEVSSCIFFYCVPVIYSNLKYFSKVNFTFLANFHKFCENKI